MPKIVRLENTDIKVTEQVLTEFKLANQDTIQDWQIALIKTPHQSYTIDEDPILVVNELSIVRPLNEMSLMINAISDKFENAAFLAVDKVVFDEPKVANLIKKLSTVKR